MIHGGLRYLEKFEFGLVFEALQERNLLFQIAPHLSHPLRFMVPVFKESRVPFWKLGLGMWAYDALSLFEAPELHENLNPRETLSRVPFLQDRNLKGSFVYSDGYMDDDRLVFETLRSAHRTGFLTALNFVKADSKHLQGLQIKDMLSGDSIVVKGKHIVSCSGPWTDQVGLSLSSAWKNQLRPTKGVHLTFSNERFPLPQAVVMAVEDRIVFAIPRHEMVIVGTTDTDITESPEKVQTSAEDVNYLLEVTNSYFPGLKLQKKDIVSHYAGVRPLVADSASTTGKTSREHRVWTEDEVTFVAGGKYTTYRLMAEEVVHHALSFFSIEDRARFSHSFSKAPLNPAITEDSYPLRQEALDWLSQRVCDKSEDVSQFVDRFGHESMDFWKTFGEKGDTIAKIEAKVAVETTSCRNLDDFFRRRVPWFLARKDHGLSEVDAVAKVFQSYFQWNESEKNQKISDLKVAWMNYHKLTLPEGPS